MELIRKGKVKDVYDAGDHLHFVFTDKISVFDKIIPTTIEGKGTSLCMTAAFWFKMLKERGISTHFISTARPNEMDVKKYQIVKRNTGQKSNFLIPLEFVTRYYVAGTLMDRLKSGKVNYKDLGFKRFPEYGEAIPEPMFEMTTKFEDFDRPLELREASEISGLDRGEIDDVRALVLRIDRIMKDEVEKRNLLHADGKKELAMDSERKPVVVDTFGTADEDRFWDLQKYKAGKVEELSKEFVRQYYRNTGYYEALYRARNSGLQEPDIPPLPEDLRDRTVKLYRFMYTAITGNPWNF